MGNSSRRSRSQTSYQMHSRIQGSAPRNIGSKQRRTRSFEMFSCDIHTTPSIPASVRTRNMVRRNLPPGPPTNPSRQRYGIDSTW